MGYLPKDLNNYLAVKYVLAEVAKLKFRALLLVPKRNTETKYKDFAKTRTNFNVSRTKVIEELLPDYLKFMEGVVYLSMLPDKLPKNEVLKLIRKKLVSECLELLKGLSTDKDDYNQFSKNLKLGVHEDFVNRKKLLGLLRFQTSASGDEFCSLSDYV